MSVLTEHINGRTPNVSATPMHTFRDSGVTVKLRKLSPMTGHQVAQQVQRELAESKPEPPIVEVDYGQGKIQQPHTGDPVYKQRLAAWDAEVTTIANQRMFKLAALLAVEVTIQSSERAQIARTKRLLKITTGVEWHDDPELDEAENLQLFYMTHIACGSPDDLQEFYQAIATRSGPTEAAIERHKESFPSDV